MWQSNAGEEGAVQIHYNICFGTRIAHISVYVLHYELNQCVMFSVRIGHIRTLYDDGANASVTN